MASTWSAWTTDTLALHLAQQVGGDATSSETAASDHVLTLTRQAGIEVWTRNDWWYRHKSGTITTVADASSVDAPTDFGEFDQRSLRDYDDSTQGVTITGDTRRWQEVADSYASDHTAEPRLVMAVRDTVETTWAWHFLFTPTPDAVYEYPYWYVAADPWTTGSLADSAAPVWPPAFDMGWYLLARYRVFEGRRTEEEVAAARKSWRDWLADSAGEIDETVTTDDEPILDPYKDTQRFASNLLD